jgi:hypothetical protein
VIAQATQTDWTLVTALLTAIGALCTVIGILWWRYNQARDNYENLLREDRDDLVPAMVKLSDTARQLSENANKLLEESIKLRTYRRGEGAGSTG